MIEKLPRLGAMVFAATLAASTAITSLPVMAQTISTFAQSVAEASVGDEDIAAFYRDNDYQPIWTSGSAEDQARILALFQAIQHADDHGLPLADYDTAALEAEMRAIDSPRDLGRVEVELSKLLLTYARQIETGILTPAKVDEGIKREVPLRDRTEILKSFTKAQPAPFLRSLPPKSEEYARLMREKLRLEHLRATGGWGQTVSAASLGPGATGPQVIELRNRLVKMGYLDRSATQTYDDNIQRAVQRFQTDMGLNADGVAGNGTMNEINTGIDERLESIIVAMERERWMNIERGDRYIWVNLTTFAARIVDGGKVTFETRSVIGKDLSTHRTPEFSDVMEARSFPFAMSQPPGPGNALGYVKFMFPNQYNIYLHDTPSKSLFSHDVRAYSHGCIRLAEPFEFAYAMLAPQSSDPKAEFTRVLNTGAETKIDLVNPVPVHLVYRTAYTDTRGVMNYREDIYGRDAKIWSALQSAGVTLRALDS